MSTSRVSRYAAAVFVATLALTACASEEPDGASASGSSATNSGEHSTGSTSSPPTEEPADDDVVEVSVSVQNGEVDPPTQRVEVEQGQQVRLIVTSDVDDEIHVHGIDVAAELEAGQPATVEFEADQTGLFEVETHETELLLLQLEIR